MTRKTRRTLITAIPETTYGTPVDPGEPLLVEDPDFMIDRDVVPRNLVRPYFGGAEHLIGTRRAVIKFKTELAGSGAAGTAPAWGKLLRGSGFAETLTAGNRAEYSPITDAMESLTFTFNRDGVRYVSRGARGTCKLDMTAYQRPMMEWEFWGFDTTAFEVSMTSPSLAAWKKPAVITDANSGDISLGGSYAAGVISGGTSLKSRGMQIDLGNKLSHIKLLGGEACEITDRDVSGKMQVELTAAEEVAWRTAINGEVLTSVGFQIGTTAGSRVGVFGAAVQRVNPQAEDYEGRVLIGADLRFLPTSGNDDLRIVAR